MASFNIIVNASINSKAIGEAIELHVDGAQAILDATIIKDSNYYVPLATGVLQKTAITSTVLGSGMIIWDTPYARRQYYGDNFDHSKQYNPNATSKWFESAKARQLSNWVKLVNDEYRKEHK